VDTEVCFRSAADRAAFSTELTAAIAGLVSKYHDPSAPGGRAHRLVVVEVEVPGTPEEVWQAIATGPGISSWFAPVQFEEQDGKPVAMTTNFGPGMESRSVVTAWDAPRKFTSEAAGWFPGSPPIATEWSV
jgi:hypothetical protein